MPTDQFWIDEEGRCIARCMDCNVLMHLVKGKLVHLQVDDDGQVSIMCDACAARLEKAKSGRTN